MMADRIKKRRPWLAAVLSLLLMGLGQLYNGSLRKSVAYFVFEICIQITFIAVLLTTFVHAPWALAAVAILAMVYAIFRIWAAISAYIAARRLAQTKLKSYNRWYVYLGLVVIAYGNGLLVDPEFNRSLTPAFASYSTPSGSMAPTIEIGDFLLAATGAFVRHAPEPGDLAIFKLPKDQETDYLKRVVASPGDRVQLRQGLLHINGMPVKREKTATRQPVNPLNAGKEFIEYRETLPNGRQFLIWEENDNSHLDNTPEYMVPAGHYFVLGDNRDNSRDSRANYAIGFIPEANFTDRPLYIIWSDDLSRIGRTVD